MVTLALVWFLVCFDGLLPSLVCDGWVFQAQVIESQGLGAVTAATRVRIIENN